MNALSIMNDLAQEREVVRRHVETSLFFVRQYPHLILHLIQLTIWRIYGQFNILAPIVEHGDKEERCIVRGPMIDRGREGRQGRAAIIDKAPFRLRFSVRNPDEVAGTP